MYILSMNRTDMTADSTIVNKYDIVEKYACEDVPSFYGKNSIYIRRHFELILKQLSMNWYDNFILNYEVEK